MTSHLFEKPQWTNNPCESDVSLHGYWPIREHEWHQRSQLYTILKLWNRFRNVWDPPARMGLNLQLRLWWKLLFYPAGISIGVFPHHERKYEPPWIQFLVRSQPYCLASVNCIFFICETQMERHRCPNAADGNRWPVEALFMVRLSQLRSDGRRSTAPFTLDVR